MSIPPLPPFPETWSRYYEIPAGGGAPASAVFLRPSAHFRAHHPAFRRTPSNTTAAAAASGLPAVRRIDPADGALYTEAEFVAHYGRIDEWVAAGASVSNNGAAEPTTSWTPAAGVWEELDVAGIRRELKTPSQGKSTPEDEAEFHSDGTPAEGTETAATPQQVTEGCLNYYSGPSGSGPDGESDGEWIAEETLVLDDSWAEHFVSRAKQRVVSSRPATTAESSHPSSKPNIGASGGNRNPSKTSSGEAMSRRRKRGPKKSSQSGSSTTNNNIAARAQASPATVARWKGVRYVTEDLSHVRAAEAAVRKVAQQYGKGRWPLYPDMPITSPSLG